MAFGEVPAEQFEVLRRIAAYQTPDQLAGQLLVNQTTDSQLLDKMKELV